MNRRIFLSALAGASVVRGARAGSMLRALAAPDISELAHDPNRPACHLMPPHNWMNDPNGPIWWKGEYHLFYQLNPYAADWGSMHWGHAASTDMIQWRHEPIALAPTPGGPDSEGCFSGSAVVFEGKPTFIYTGVQNAPPAEVTLHDGNDKLRETQLLAVAEDDRLLHWKKDPQPVIPEPPAGMKVTGFRDPCPWREGDTWYCGVGSGERGVGGFVLLYRSKDLRHWEYVHKLAEGKPNGKHAANPCDSGEMWECPDFFALGDRHCLLYSTENKVIWTTGHYDREAHVYRPERSGVLDQGASYYAPKSFLAPGGRRILWGWLRETRPQSEYVAAGWAGVMSLPRVLTIGAQGQLEMRVAKEAETLRGPGERAEVTSAKPYRRRLDTLQREVHVKMDLLSDAVVTVRLIEKDRAAWELTIDVPEKQVRCGDVAFPFPGLPWPRPDLRMWLDGSVMEAFVGDREALTSRVYGMEPGATELEVSVRGSGKVPLKTWELKAISTDRMTS